MSEAIRIYSTGKRAKRAPARTGSGIPGGLIVLFLIICIPIAAYLFWISRDSRDVQEFLPAGAAFEFVLNEPLATRDRLANSFIWSLLPEEHAIQATPDALRTPLELPSWVERNWFPSYCYVGAGIGESIEDLLLVTRMSRVGVITERAYRFRGAVAGANVEGLRIYFWKPHNLYYAVRGRIMLASPSLRTLITALTLTPDERAEPSEIAGLFTQTGKEIRGRYRSPDQSGIGQTLTALSFALEEDAQSIDIKLQAALHPDFKERLSNLLGTSAPSALPPVPAGMLRVAADFDLPVHSLAPSLGQLLEIPILSKAQWAAWESGPEGAFAPVLTSVFRDAGPQIAAAWRGFDLDEMIPAPIIVAVADRAANAASAVALVGEAATNEDCPLPLAYADETNGRIYVPSISGPALESVIQNDGPRLRYVSNRSIADAFFAEELSLGQSPGQGHIFAEAQPNAIIDTLAEAGAFLAENAMLNAHDTQSWETQIQHWRERWSTVQKLNALISEQDGILRADIHIDLYSEQ